MPLTPNAKTILETDEVLGPRLKAALSTGLWNRLPRDLDRDRLRWRLDVLKFRPRRRLSLRLGIPFCNGRSPGGELSFIMKIWYNRRGEHISRRLTDLNARLITTGEKRFCLPAPLFYDAKNHAMAYRQTEGRPITRDLKRGLSRDWIERLCDVFAGFHRLRLEGLPIRTAEDELACVREGLAGQPLPHALRRSLASLLALLEDRKPVPSDRALIHRDLYDQQILLCDDGRIGLIDLDDIALGDPMLDLGNLVAHVHLMTHWRRRPEKLARVRRRLVSGYANRLFEDFDALAVSERWYEAVALARLSVFRARAGQTEFALEMARAARDLVKRAGARKKCRA